MKGLILGPCGKILVYSQTKLWVFDPEDDQDAAPKLLKSFTKTIKSILWKTNKNSKINTGIILTSRQIFTIDPKHTSTIDETQIKFEIKKLNYFHKPLLKNRDSANFKIFYESAAITESGRILSVLIKRLKPKIGDPMVRSMFENRSTEIVNFVREKDFDSLDSADEIEALLQKFNPDEKGLVEFIKNRTGTKDEKWKNNFTLHTLLPFSKWTNNHIDNVERIYNYKNSIDLSLKIKKEQETCPITGENLVDENVAFVKSSIGRYSKCSLTRKALTANVKCKHCTICDSVCIDDKSTVGRKCRYCGHKFRSKT